MENYVLNNKQMYEKLLSFDEWVCINLDILNDIIYKITYTLTNDSKVYNFEIDEISLSNEILDFLYKTSYSKYKNKLNIRTN
tara:strand:- start:1046 stop:1291 length:246 start_codon:yes stop_codon:yes gene_type:complete